MRLFLAKAKVYQSKSERQQKLPLSKQKETLIKVVKITRKINEEREGVFMSFPISKDPNAILLSVSRYELVQALTAARSAVKIQSERLSNSWPALIHVDQLSVLLSLAEEVLNNG